MRRILCLAFLLLAGLAYVRPAASQSLVFDLSSHHIAISAGFSGTDVLLYGTTEGEGDVIVVLRGPEMPVVVRRKTRVLGIWINTEQLTFSGVPAFYRVAASRPLDEIALPTILARHQIGLDYLRMTPSTIDFNADAAAFREGLVRNKERNEQFSSEIGRVAFLGPRLFRTRVYLPANVPSGSYTAEVLLVNNGQVIAAQTTPMFVEQTGIGAEVHDFAHRRAALYGIVTVLFALLAGWGAGVFFRRRV